MFRDRSRRPGTFGPARPVVAALGLLCGAAATMLAGCTIAREVTVTALKTVGDVGTGLWRVVAGPYDEKTEHAAATADFGQEVQRLCHKASQLHDSGQLDEAAALLRQVIEEYPDEIDARLQLAGILEEQGRLDESEAAADAVLIIAPESIEALLLKAKIADSRGRAEKALERYHRVLALSPGNVTAQLRAAHLELCAEHPERAAPLLRAVCQSTQTPPEQRVEALWTLGVAYGLQHRWDDAVTALAEAAPYRPRMTADDWYRLAYARHQSGDLEGARRDLQHALQLQPRHEGATAMDEQLRRGGRFQ